MEMEQFQREFHDLVKKLHRFSPLIFQDVAAEVEAPAELMARIKAVEARMILLEEKLVECLTLLKTLVVEEGSDKPMAQIPAVVETLIPTLVVEETQVPVMETLVVEEGGKKPMAQIPVMEPCFFRPWSTKM